MASGLKIILLCTLCCSAALGFVAPTQPSQPTYGQMGGSACAGLTRRIDGRIDGVVPRIAGVGATKLSAPEQQSVQSSMILKALAMVFRSETW